MTQGATHPNHAFRPMGATYLLGVFNDNFFKEAAILLAFAAGLSELQSPIIKTFSIPFILFSAYAGYFADRFRKRNVVIASKYLELFAMLLGAVGLIFMNFSLIVAMVFLMALQSTLFGPALNGAIPEVFPSRQVPKVNALLKTVTTIAIILGIVTAGLILDIRIPDASRIFPRLLLSAVIIAVAVTGVVFSHRLHTPPTKQQRPPFPWLGPIQSVRDSIALKQSPRLRRALFGSTFFYFSSTLILAAIHELCLTDLAFSTSFTSALTGVLAIGVAAGSLLSVQLSKRYSHEQLFPPVVILFGCMLLVASRAETTVLFTTKVDLALALLLTGALGGAFLIPLLTYIQVSPRGGEKGKVIGMNNFLDFCGIFVAGEMFGRLHPTFSAAKILAGMGGFSLMVAILFSLTQPNKEASHA
ncbi:MAG: MFS transporter [Deltaproteobacteria bacterium]|nr:MFS transporter [Deltaproteobacteria bacterium]MBN2671984.1 MFS transporter [Deltaproteobacteria bacterium]